MPEPNETIAHPLASAYQVRADWLTKLKFRGTPAVRPVAIDIARTVAKVEAANIWLPQTDKLFRAAEEMGQQVAATIGFTDQRVAAALRFTEKLQPILDQAAKFEKVFRRSLYPVASVASLNLVESFGRLPDPEEARDLDQVLRQYGWWIAPHWTPDLARRFARYAKTHGKRAFQRELTSYYSERRHRELHRMIDSWMVEDAFNSRRGLIREGLRDHARGRYRVSVPTLLPLVEGIAVDVFEAPRTRVGFLPFVKDGVLAATGLERTIGDALVETLGILWEWTSFEGVNPKSRALNRHLVLHGRTSGYGTEANSLRVFLALDLLSSQVGTKRRIDTSTKNDHNKT